MCLGPSQSGSLSASWTVGFSSSDPPRSLPGVYGLGRLQEHDPRSLRFAVEAPDRDPTNKTWRCGVVLNQGHTSACTGFSRVADLLAAPRMVKVDDPQDMAQRTYKLAQTLDEWPGEDYEGSSASWAPPTTGRACRCCECATPGGTAGAKLETPFCGPTTTASICGPVASRAS
jgi:hypothetical protein